MCNKSYEQKQPLVLWLQISALNLNASLSLRKDEVIMFHIEDGMNISYFEAGAVIFHAL